MATLFVGHGLRGMEMSFCRVSNTGLSTTISKFPVKRPCVRQCHSLSCRKLHYKPSKSAWLQSDRSLDRRWLVGLGSQRWNSSGVISQTQTTTPVLGENIAGYVPDPPPIPEPSEIAECLNALGEPTLSSLGLGGMMPSGWVQTACEMLHVQLGLPWFGAIAVGTVILRLCMFPLVIKSQKNAAHLHNHMPTMSRLQERFSKARLSGNTLEAARTGNELMEFMKRNEIKPFKNFLVPIAQLPVFVSMFVGLRQMANLPVESMKTGGALWFTDLTIADPFYALPLMTMATFLLTVEVGVDGVKADTMSHNMKWFMRAMPIFIFPFISNFPMALLCYWFTSNTFSLAQVLFLKIPAVREYFAIPVLVKHDKSAMPPKQGFVEGFKSSWKNSKVIQEMEDRERVDAVKFREAGLGPIQKTYSYDPTKVQKQGQKSNSPKAVSAKSKT